MQVRTASSAAELRDAAWISRSRYFWVKLSARNIHAMMILAVLLGVIVLSLIHHETPKFEQCMEMLVVLAFVCLMTWYRWNKMLKQNGAALKPRAGMMSLDGDGIRTTLETGATSFVPWGSYVKWVEGKKVFVLTGSDGSTILPIDEGNRDLLRGTLQSHIAASFTR
jgi:hypothetical protein